MIKMTCRGQKDVIKCFYTQALLKLLEVLFQILVMISEDPEVSEDWKHVTPNQRVKTFDIRVEDPAFLHVMFISNQNLELKTYFT